MSKIFITLTEIDFYDPEASEFSFSPQINMATATALLLLCTVVSRVDEGKGQKVKVFRITTDRSWSSLNFSFGCFSFSRDNPSQKKRKWKGRPYINKLSQQLTW